MPRPKILPDADVLKAAHRLLHEHGPEALTFERLGRACGLSAATLVQRFGSKAGLLAGNHFMTIVSGAEHLADLGRLTLWKGAQPILIDRLDD